LLRAGATNIISKPFDFEILSIRTKGHLEHRIFMQSLKAYQQRVQQELDAA
jgi:DNA-binding response OmpR family regulator